MTHLHIVHGTTTGRITAPRVADSATAQGLRQHSISSAFPAVVVGKGINPTLWYVTLGGHWSGEYSDAGRAGEFADIVGHVVREHGFTEAVALVEDDAAIALSHNLSVGG